MCGRMWLRVNAVVELGMHVVLERAESVPALGVQPHERGVQLRLACGHFVHGALLLHERAVHLSPKTRLVERECSADLGVAFAQRHALKHDVGCVLVEIVWLAEAPASRQVHRDRGVQRCTPERLAETALFVHAQT